MEKAEALRIPSASAVLSNFLVVVLCAHGSMQATPQEGSLRAADLVELSTIDTTIRLDIRYATPRNFTGRAVYPAARAFLQRPAAEALLRVEKRLRSRGYGLVVFDAYRPLSVTKLFWDITPKAKRKFVANPSKGSRHNRGCAVDCSLYWLASGMEVGMTTPFDEFSERASAYYHGGTRTQRRERNLLRELMEHEGFAVNPDEWWHFDYRDWARYPILDTPFDQIR